MKTSFMWNWENFHARKAEYRDLTYLFIGLWTIGHGIYMQLNPSRSIYGAFHLAFGNLIFPWMDFLMIIRSNGWRQQKYGWGVSLTFWAGSTGRTLQTFPLHVHMSFGRVRLSFLLSHFGLWWLLVVTKSKDYKLFHHDSSSHVVSSSLSERKKKKGVPSCVWNVDSWKRRERCFRHLLQALWKFNTVCSFPTEISLFPCDTCWGGPRHNHLRCVSKDLIKYLESTLKIHMKTPVYTLQMKITCPPLDTRRTFAYRTGRINRNHL